MTGPSPDQPLRIGTRASPLAMAQAVIVRDGLLAAHHWHADAVVLVPMVATGDVVQDRALAEVGGKELWTRELDVMLRDGQVDACVHSMKDVETIRPDAFEIIAALPRADARDVLIGPAAISDLPAGAQFGTASPRRAAQLRALRPDLDIVLLRGNVQTRLDKVASGAVAGTFLAAAGLARLGMAHIGVAQDFAQFLPAPSQGIIGVEILASSPHRAAIAVLDDADTHFALHLERAFLAALGADCHSALAAHCMRDTGAHNGTGDWSFTAELLMPDGSHAVAGVIAVDGDDAQRAMPAVVDLAQRLLADAPPALRALYG